MSGCHPIAGCRVAVVGTSGSGKSTFSSRLAGMLGAPHVELDVFQHGPNWQQATRDELRERTAAAVERDAWVCDGNYAAVRDLVWLRATDIVWFDFPLPLVMSRVVRRSFRYAIGRQPMFNGNTETFRAWLDPTHPIRWAWSTHKDRREQYGALVRSSAYRHARVHHLRTPKDAEQLLRAVGASA